MVNYPINEEYFKDEERSGFMVSSLMKRCWAAQLRTLEDFDRVCSKHNLKWYAFCGTLLGAVRHKGFIPWDDDVDICMLRGDYNMFLHYAAKEMPGYYIESCDKRYPEDGFYNDWLGITRINNSIKADFEPEHLSNNYMFPYTVGIDLYPLDYVTGNKEEYEMQINIFKYIIGVSYKYKIDNWKDYKSPDDEFAKINLEEAFNTLYECTGVRIDRNGDVLKQLNELATNISSYTKGKNAQYVACMAHMAQDHRNMIFPKEAFAKRAEVPFENGNIYIPSEYNIVLSINYGLNYMTPNTSVPHDYPYYKKQERWVRDYVIRDPEMAPYMPAYYIADVYDEDPDKKILLDKIYGMINASDFGDSWP